MNAEAGVGSLRVWWIPQVPMPAFYVDVPDVASGELLLDVLADYDRFQYEHNVKPDYCNTGGLQRLERDGWEDLDVDGPIDRSAL